MTWDDTELQRHVNEGIEESSGLEYKGAGALNPQNPDAIEITKDISAMANSAGGVVIYGIKEFPKPKKHVPEKIDPIDRVAFNKERLEHIINTIHPRLHEFTITPVPLSSGPNDVCYVIEVPQGRTAHQARDHKYYRRYNFESVPMEDYEIRLVMNRLTVPDASIEFKTKLHIGVGATKHYLLSPVIKNLGSQAIRDFKLIFTFPNEVLHGGGAEMVNRLANISSITDKDRNQIVSFQSSVLLFPEDERYWKRNGLEIHHS
ncbi:MAG: transcriptional regulator [Acidobacteria bacterium]|nr:transcriptional regulator [Acidobacteriota bacterium]